MKPLNNSIQILKVVIIGIFFFEDVFFVLTELIKRIRK